MNASRSVHNSLARRHHHVEEELVRIGEKTRYFLQRILVYLRGDKIGDKLLHQKGRCGDIALVEFVPHRHGTGDDRIEAESSLDLCERF